mmetsp:Transcript_4862/g.6862  ORF Transcript_4862/g.6862 Transcript_4862/m.6862 type:complete len:313 (-) Transcript_4862:148-1086(-)|eukprot:jgi/Bigna1/47218/estExt_Genewise1.C_110064
MATKEAEEVQKSPKRQRLSGPSLSEQLEIVKVLYNNLENKTLTTLGRHRKTGDKAVILFKKHPFEENEIGKELALESKKTFENSRFAKYLMQSLSPLTCEVICPATDKDIRKYSPQEKYLLRETAEIYRSVAKPIIDAVPESDIEWVYNIIDGKKEQENVLLQKGDDGYMCFVDYKWEDKSQKKGLHLLGLPTERKTLRSIRDLRGEHLAMLKKMREDILLEINKRFSIPSSQVLAYFHYYPTFWHLHIHFQHVLGSSMGREIGRAIPLDDVIENLTADGNYYAKATITCMVSSVKHADIIKKAIEENAVEI